MNAAYLYEPLSTSPESRSWRPIDLLVVGLWLATPIGVFAVRKPTLHVFEEYGGNLLTTTQYLLHFYSPYLLAIASIVVILAMLIIPYGSAGRRFASLACISGVLVGAICSLAILGPLWSLWRDLN